MVGSTLFQPIFEDMSNNANSAQTVRRRSYGRFFLGAIVATLALAALWMVIAWQWNFSEGERAGWVQKFSKKGWLCKTWEGEIALVSMPGAIPEKFEFTVLDDAVAAQINRYMGQRVSLTYAQKVGLPTSCFGDTRYYVTAVLPVNELQNYPGVITVPVNPAPAPAAAPVQPAAPVTPVQPAQPAPPAQPAQPAPSAQPAQPAPMPVQPPAVTTTPGLPSAPAPMPSQSGAPAVPGAPSAPSAPSGSAGVVQPATRP
jgi:hypothetical protein